MEPLSAGASVLAFLGLALKSAKAIHDVFSAIKDEPRNVGDLMDELTQLKSILERLLQIQVGQASDTGMIDLLVPMKKCAEDVANFSLKLQCLKLSGVDSKAGRLWRRIKAAITEKDLEKMRDISRGHVLMLNFQLSILQTARLSLSATQSSDILGLLNQLKDDRAKNCVPGTSTNGGVIGFRSLGMTTAGEKDDTSLATDLALEKSISRLTKLVARKECTVESDDAEELMKDLQTLLEYAQKEQSISTPLGGICSDICQDSQLEIDSNVSKELNLVNSLISSAPSIAINKNGMLYPTTSKT
jgi:hypothetical protein